MTREEAIQYLNKLYTRAELTDVYGDMEDMTPYEEALDMAIQALEQEPCSDAVSRQAVLDYIDQMPSELTSDGRRMIRRRALEEYISDTLPSVNPQEPKTGHWEFVGDDCYRCTACGEVYTSNQFDAINNYYDNRFPKGCPNCGAKMESR